MVFILNALGIILHENAKSPTPEDDPMWQQEFTWFFALFHHEVAPHLTVVRRTCKGNEGPDILLLACSPAQPGGRSWTPQRYSAPIWRALPEAKPARATSASTRARTSGSCVLNATRRSAPRKAPRFTACASPPRLSPSW